MREHRTLLRLAAGIRGHLAASVALRLASAACAVVQAILVALVLRDLLDGAPLRDEVGRFVGIAVVLVTRAVLVWGNEVVAQLTGNVVKLRIRSAVFRKLLELGPGHAVGARTGEIRSCLVDGIEALEAYYAGLLPAMIVAAVVPTAIGLYVLAQDVALGLVLACFLVVTPVAPRVWNRMLAASSGRVFEAWGKLGADYLDSMQGLTTLKSFNASGRRRTELVRSADGFVRATMRTLRLALLHHGFLTLGMLGGTVAVIAIGVNRVGDGSMAAGTLFLVLFLSREAFRPFAELSMQFHASHSARVAGAAIAELLATASPTPEPAADAPSLAPPAPTVAFEDVTFAYDADRAPALRNLSFVVGQGETIGIVGRSGAGKTTVVSLLLRFFDPDEGRILVGGIDIRDLPIDVLRSTIAVVSQDTYLFNGTIADNIRFARPDAGDAEVEAAARAANAHEFVAAMPEGYATMVGERGLRVSGGQRQRIAIARALLKDAPILVLDEATASVDAAAEAAIREALDRLTQDRTTIVIAHRLSTVRDADRLLVLSDGVAVESGDHVELLSRNGEYARLVGAQADA